MLLGKKKKKKRLDIKPTQSSPEMSDGKYFTCPLGKMAVDYVWRGEALRRRIIGHLIRFDMNRFVYFGLAPIHSSAVFSVVSHLNPVCEDKGG